MRKTLALVTVLAALAAGCGGDGDARAEDATTTRDPASIVLPERLLGLRVVAEDIGSKLRQVSDSYLDGVGLFSFRQDDDLLRATLQVGRFNDIAEPDRVRFRNAIIAQLGSTVPRQLRLGEERVYLTAGNEQNIFVWFDRDAFFVLSIRKDYQFPRTMLRRLVELEIIT